MINPIEEPESPWLLVNPSPYQFSQTFYLTGSNRSFIRSFILKTSFRVIAMLINHPQQFVIHHGFLYHQNACYISARFTANTRRRRTCRFSIVINRADIIDPFVWATEDPKELIFELLADLSTRKSLLKGTVKREHTFVTVDERYYVKPPNSINHHAVAVFTCKELPGVQFKLDKTLDGSPPFYELRTMDNVRIQVYGKDYWSGVVLNKCISWHKAFTIARIYAIGYLRKNNPVT